MKNVAILLVALLGISTNVLAGTAVCEVRSNLKGIGKQSLEIPQDGRSYTLSLGSIQIWGLEKEAVLVGSYDKRANIQARVELKPHTFDVDYILSASGRVADIAMQERTHLIAEAFLGYNVADQSRLFMFLSCTNK